MDIKNTIKEYIDKQPWGAEFKSFIAKFNIVEPAPATTVAAPVALAKTETLKDGTVISYEGEKLDVGVPVTVMVEGVSSPAPDGEHELADGSKVTIAGGVVTAITPVTPAADPAPAMPQQMFEALQNDIKAINVKLSALEKENGTLKTENVDLKKAVHISLSTIEMIASMPAPTKNVTAKSWDEMTALEKRRANKN